MFFLLISLKPTNCMITANLLLYAAVAVYWVLSLMGPFVIEVASSINE